jgi:hypothetical protein
MRGACLPTHPKHAGVLISFDRLESPMDSNRSRTGVLVGLAAAAGAFGVAAMISAATAPTARADDFTDIVNAVEAELAFGQAAFTTASTDFGSSDVTDGLQALVNGSYDDLLGAPDSLYIGTVEALTNETVISGGILDFNVDPPPTDFADAVSNAQAAFAEGEDYFANAATDLSAGDYGGAAELDAFGSIFTFDLPAQELLVGGVEALGF